MRRSGTTGGRLDVHGPGLRAQDARPGGASLDCPVQDARLDVPYDALRLGQFARQLKSMLQNDRRFPRGIAPPGSLSHEPQVLDRAQPIGALLVVKSQLGRYFAQPLREQGLQPLTDPSMQHRPASHRLPAIEHLAVQRVHEVVARGDGPVR